MKKLFVGILIVMVMIGFTISCTAIKVKPVPIELKVETICVQKNPKVKHTSFLPDLKKEFSYYGIKLRSFNMAQKAFIDEQQHYPKEVKEQCDYIMTYVANWTWDMAMYCWRIELHLYNKDNVEIADALFELVGKGGFALTKFDSTKSKIRKLLIKFMVNYPYVIKPPKPKYLEETHGEGK